MKKNSETMFNQMSKVQVQNLTEITNETIDYGYRANNHKIYSTADLWNIQRQQKNRIQRRFSF